MESRHDLRGQRWIKIDIPLHRERIGSANSLPFSKISLHLSKKLNSSKTIFAFLAFGVSQRFLLLLLLFFPSTFFIIRYKNNSYAWHIVEASLRMPDLLHDVRK